MVALLLAVLANPVSFPLASPAVSPSAPAVSAFPSEILLWPQGAPGALGSAAEDRPSLYAFPAPAGKANGTAAIVCPGGAYGMLAIEKEGFQVARWLNSLGISAFVLKYRLGPRYRHPAPVTDAKRAMRWVRANAPRYGIDPLAIGMVGFSAGGHLAATVATRYDGGRSAPDDPIDSYPCQPAFQVLVYPVITMDAAFTHLGSRRNLLGVRPDSSLVGLLSNELHVTAATPPAFLVHARPDPIVPFRNSEAYAEACRKSGVSVEFRAYDKGTHAFGLGRDPVAREPDPAGQGPGGMAEPADWPAHCSRWLGRQGFLPQLRATRSSRSIAP